MMWVYSIPILSLALCRMYTYTPSTPPSPLAIIIINATARHSTVTSSIHSPAVDPDLAVGAGERADAGHPDHRRREVAPPAAGVGRVGADEAVRCAATAASEERLVGVQQAAAGEQVPVVVVVEVVRRRPVQRLQRAVAGGARLRRAARLQRRREGGVDVGVVVDPRPEVPALRPPDGVGP